MKFFLWALVLLALFVVAQAFAGFCRNPLGLPNDDINNNE
jgi:hypothetical protein